jgi:hypothetical protein
VRQEQSIPVLLTGIMLCSGLFAGCHHAAAPVTEEDVAKAQADAQKEVDDARIEARKDVKNALKQDGADSKNVTVARVTGSFDVAMAKSRSRSACCSHPTLSNRAKIKPKRNTRRPRRAPRRRGYPSFGAAELTNDPGSCQLAADAYDLLLTSVQRFR